MAKLDLIIDGVGFKIDISDLSRSARIVPKVQESTEDGGLYRELLGTYLDYNVSFGIAHDMTEYDRLFNMLIKPVEYRNVTLPINNEYKTLRCYVENVADSVHKVLSDGTRFKALTCSFIAIEPILRGKDY